MDTYKIQMYIKATAKDAVWLRKNLAQIVYDEFELSSVFGVSVEQENPPASVFEKVMVLCMVELGDGLNTNQISNMLPMLTENRDYIPIEFHTDNTSAIGFINSDYYQVHDYKPEFIEEKVKAILDDIKLESPDKTYMTPDGSQFYMDYFNG